MPEIGCEQHSLGRGGGGNQNINTYSTLIRPVVIDVQKLAHRELTCITSLPLQI